MLIQSNFIESLKEPKVSTESHESSNLKAMVVNIRHMKVVPGLKTDIKDVERIADLLRHGLLQPVDSCFAAVAAAFGDFTAAKMVHKVKP